MTFSIPERLAALRQCLAQRGLDACIIPSDDIHQSEYVCDHFKYRAYLSGFTGSCGTLVVSQHQAGLWTDSRYFLQAEQQLQGSGIQLFKMNTPGCPDLVEWIVKQSFKSLGIDNEVFSYGAAQRLIDTLETVGCRVDIRFCSYEEVWKDRPSLPDNKLFILDEAYAGASFQEKLSAVRTLLQEGGANTLPLSGLDDIAWLFNLRGSDVAFSPVGLCFALIESDRCSLFVEETKLTEETRHYLQQNQVFVEGYRQLPTQLAKLTSEAIVWLDKARLNHRLVTCLPSHCRIKEGLCPTTLLKAIKNDTELAGIRKAVVKDGIALVRHWRWLESALEQGTDELEIAQQLADTRKQMEHCYGESFNAIVGCNGNGAIVHYAAKLETNTKVGRDCFLLNDNGGQYLEGTTDITRSFSFYAEGHTPQDYLNDYAAVLKGHIALASCVFPEQTRGSQLDVLARQFLWKQAKQYGHGTGHGIGHFLNVHEGPQSIRLEENPTTLKVGMLLSNEPGLYQEGRYGIRIENMVLVREHCVSEFGRFLSFETLSLCPLDLNAIDPQLYTAAEIDWINHYHQQVYQKLAPHLNQEEQAWLQHKTRTIQ